MNVNRGTVNDFSLIGRFDVFESNIRYESDDVIWLRNHASTWILVPNIGCKQNHGVKYRRTAYFFWCSHIFFLSDYPEGIRRGEISFKSNHVILRQPIAE